MCQVPEREAVQSAAATRVTACFPARAARLRRQWRRRRWQWWGGGPRGTPCWGGGCSFKADVCGNYPNSGGLLQPCPRRTLSSPGKVVFLSGHGSHLCPASLKSCFEGAPLGSGRNTRVPTPPPERAGDVHTVPGLQVVTGRARDSQPGLSTSRILDWLMSTRQK